MTLETLRTKLDSLVWENSQLEIENRRLRESNQDQAAMVDLEAELERSKEDTVHLTEQLGPVSRTETERHSTARRGPETTS